MFTKKAFLLCLLFVAGTLATVTNILWLQFVLFNPTDDLNFIEDNASLIIDSATDQVIYKIHLDAPKVQSSTKLGNIPIACTSALISTEDSSFETNIGINTNGLVRGTIAEITGQSYGGSSLTQQFVKVGLNSYFSRSPMDKVLEMIFALRTNITISKQEILETYLNNVYFGNFHYGIKEAAKLYFDKKTNELNIAECSFLIGIINKPVALDPFTNFTEAKERQVIVLDLMEKHGYISGNQKENALKLELKISTSHLGKLEQLKQIVPKVSLQLPDYIPEGVNINLQTIKVMIEIAENNEVRIVTIK